MMEFFPRALFGVQKGFLNIGRMAGDPVLSFYDYMRIICWLENIGSPKLESRANETRRSTCRKLSACINSLLISSRTTDPRGGGGLATERRGARDRDM